MVSEKNKKTEEFKMKEKLFETVFGYYNEVGEMRKKNVKDVSSEILRNAEIKYYNTLELLIDMGLKEEFEQKYFSKKVN